MDADTQIKLQAFLDGELPEDEARAMASLIARDAEAKALHAELKNTRHALKTTEGNVRLPESREFFWSKIERDIERLEPVVRPEPSVSWFERLRRALLPVTAVAVVLLAGLMAYQQFLPRHAPEVEMAMGDSETFTYRDYSAGMTLVWLPFPAENDLAPADAPTTIQ